MEFLRAKIRRTKLGELAYFAINAILPFAILILIYSFDSVYPALILVLLSKWRILALRPRFWWINIKANSVDLLVGVSTVGLLYVAMPVLWLQFIIVLAAELWLLYIKPKSSLRAIIIQAAIAQFVALVLLFDASAYVPEFALVMGCWAIGYSVARHVISSYEESSMELLSLIWGLFLAQLGWLFYHWTIAYDLGLPVRIPQIALVVMILSFAVARLYGACKTNRLTQTLSRNTLIFCSTLLVIVLIFSRWDISI